MSMTKRSRKPITIRARRAITGYIFILPFILGFLVFMVRPLFNSLYMSFCEVNPNGLTMEWTGTANYKYAFAADPEFSLKTIYTPGHTTDSVIFYSEKDHAAFVGDTIFKGSSGNWQYPGGDLRKLQHSIIKRIFTLPDETVLLSGHSDQTTVGTEKRR